MEVDSIPKDAKAKKDNVILEGKSNTHRIVKGRVFLKKVDEFIFGYLEAYEGAYLTHPEHGEEQEGTIKKAPIAKGFYELRQQHEQTHEGMKKVVD